MQLIECVPNISEGRNKIIIDKIVDVIETVEGVKLLNVDPGKATNRTVITFVGEPEKVIKSAFLLIQKAQELGQKLIITTDHGTINCKHPTKVIGNKNISSNLRYKTGKSLSYNDKDVFAVKNPKDISLPSISFNSPFIFAKENLFFAYPNNYNHFVQYYNHTFQHGGISLEEVLIPYISLKAK